MKMFVSLLYDIYRCLSLVSLLLTLNISTTPQQSVKMLIGTTPPQDASDLMEVSKGSLALTVPPINVADPSTSALASVPAPCTIHPLGSFLDLDFDGLMKEIIFCQNGLLLSLSSWQPSTLVYLKSVEPTFYNTLKNCVNTIMTNEHVPLKSLVNMLLSSTSNVINLMSLEDTIDASSGHIFCVSWRGLEELQLQTSL